MSFFNLFTSPSVCLVDSKGVTLRMTKSKQSFDFSFTPGEFAHMEVVDPPRLEKSLENFFSSLKSRGEMYLVLGNDLSFYSFFSKEDGAGEFKDRFINSVPIESSNLIFKALKTKNGYLFYAVNSKIYQTIKSSAQKAGWKIKAVVPQIFLEYPDENSPEIFQLSQKIRSNKKLLNIFDLHNI